MKRLLDILVNKTSNQVESEEIPTPPADDYEGVKIDVSNFESIEPSDQDQTVCFIDGGNSELISSSEFSFQFMRLVATSFKKNQFISLNKKEIYVLVSLNNDNYEVHTEPETVFNGMIFHAYDKTLSESNRMVSASKVGNVIRRFAELDYAKEMTAHCNHLIIDGSFDAIFTHEQEYLNALRQSGDDNHTGLGALSKSCRLVTRSGASMITLLLDISPDSNWHYNKVFNKRDPALHDISFVKLHPLADYIFRLDFYPECDVRGLLACLLESCKDPVFIGYPYGLIKADQVARISNKESEMLKTRVMMESGVNWKKLQKNSRSLNAHQILDNISF